MTDRITAEWDRCLAEGLIGLDRGVGPGVLAHRYDVADPDVMWELANCATMAMIDAGECRLSIEHFDAAAADVGVSVDG